MHSKPWCCHICSERFSSRTRYDGHNNERHPDLNQVDHLGGFVSYEMRIFNEDIGNASSLSSLEGLWFPDGYKVYDINTTPVIDRTSNFHCHMLSHRSVLNISFYRAISILSAPASIATASGYYLALPGSTAVRPGRPSIRRPRPIFTGRPNLRRPILTDLRRSIQLTNVQAFSTICCRSRIFDARSCA